MRLEVTQIEDGALRVSTPDVPGFVRTTRGQAGVWAVLREAFQAGRGVECGTYKRPDPIDALLDDADDSPIPAVRRTARKARQAVDAVRQAFKDHELAAREAAARERQHQAALAAVASAEKALAEARRRAREVGVKPRTSKRGGGKPASTAVAERRDRVVALHAAGKRPAAIAAELGVPATTVSHDLKVLRQAGRIGR